MGRPVRFAALTVACLYAGSAYATSIGNPSVGPSGSDNASATATQGCSSCTPVAVSGTVNSTITNPGLAGYAAAGFAASTRANNTTTYSTNTAWSTAAGAALTFASVCRANGTVVLFNSIHINDKANQTLKLTGILWLFDVPPTALADGAAFNIASGNWSNIKLAVPFTTGNVANQGSGASGAVSFDVPVQGQIKCNVADVNLYGLIEVTNAYVPIANEVLETTLNVVGAN